MISFVMSITMNLLLESDHQESSDIVSEWLDVAFLDNSQMSNYRAYFHVVMVSLLTFMTIYRVRVVRRMARASYQMVAKEKKTDLELLKSCTLHIRGIPVEDRAGIGLV